METPRNLPERLQQSVARDPSALALAHGRDRVTYLELWGQVMAVAGFLRQAGIELQARVALLLENSVSYVAAYYGVQAAGAAVVALNTAAKSVDLINWLGHSGASWLILDAKHPEAAAVQEWCQGRVNVIVVNGAADGTHSWAQVLAAPALAAPKKVAPQALAAIIYTSGTTGHPKGVMLSHANLSANTSSILDYLGLMPEDKVLNILPFYYSYGNSVLHTHLSAGGCVLIENNLAYPHRVMQCMSAERATGFSGVPSTFALLLSRVKLEDYDLSALRYLTQAGGPMPPANTERLRRALPRTQLFVMYGQTEATARLSYLPPARLTEKMGSIGVAIPGVTLEVRNNLGQLVATGEPGEIWARGDNIMLGYWNDPEATRAALDNEGWLHTGDVARRDADGFLFIEGRKSDMIKTGAHRIHPKEIEEVIAELDGVAEVAVVGVADDILGQVIKAFILPKLDCELSTMQVKAHCHARLAAYKIPKIVEVVTEMPKTASGKIKKYMLMQIST